MKQFKTVAMRVDASLEMGTGHVMRCLTLADALRARGVRCQFISRTHPGNLIELVRQRGYEVTTLSAEPDNMQLVNAAEDPLPTHVRWLGCRWELDAGQTLEVVRLMQPDMLVVDHYAIDIRWEEVLQPHAGLMVIIDDLADRRHMCDFLLDQSWFGDDMMRRYQGLVPDHCVCLLGPGYALLRPEYADMRKLMPPRDGEVRRVLVFMGGSDPTNETGKVVEALTRPGLTHLLVDVLVGANHPDMSGISRMVEARPGTHVHRGLPSLAGLMMRADLMIGGGGSTTWERMCLGLPAVVICIADNQAEMSRALSRAGYLELLGDKDDVDADQISEAIRDLIRRPELLSAIGRKSSDLVVGEGASLVCDVLLRATDGKDRPCAIQAPLSAVESLKIRRASHDEADLLFEWRNDIRTRKYFRNTAPLSRWEHMNWFARNLANERSELLIALCGGEPVGCVRFDIDGEQAEVSIYLDPSRHGQGWGRSVLSQAMDWMYSVHPRVMLFRADVFAENTASAKLFQRCGYSPTWHRFEFRKTNQ